MKKHLKDYFIPHEGNQYAPHSLQKAAIVGMGVLVVLTFAITNLQSALWVTSDWLVSTVLPAVIVELTNEERQSGSLPQLRRNTILDVAATLKAQHMAQNQYFSHFSPDGVSPWYWFDVAQYNFVHAGENLAIHFTDSDDVVEAWMQSPTHRANILNGSYAEIGVGTAEGMFEGYNTVYVVQMFGTPAAAPALASTNEPEAPAPLPAVAAETTSQSDTSASEDDEVLAESVAITETVEIIEPEPERIPVEQSNDLAEADTMTDSDIADMEVTETSVALYSDHLSTSTGGIPATIDGNAELTSPSTDTSFFSEVATKPHLVLQIMYGLLAMVIVGSLLLSILIEIRHQQPLQVAYSVGLLALMAGLYQLHVVLNNTVLIV